MYNDLKNGVYCPHGKESDFLRKQGRRNLRLSPTMTGVSGRNTKRRAQTDTSFAKASTIRLEGLEESQSVSGPDTDELAYPVSEVLRPTVHASAAPADPLSSLRPGSGYTTLYVFSATTTKKSREGNSTQRPLFFL